MPPKRAGGKAPDEGVNNALKKLKDGRDGRTGSIDLVLAKVHALEAAVKRQPEIRKTLADLNLTEAYREVVDLPGREVAAAIEQVMVAIAKNVLDGEGFGYSLPSRGANDQVYLDQLDRIVLKHNTSERSFTNVGQVRKTAIMTRVFSLVHEVVTKGIHVTKRDLFYTDVKLFKKQEESDAVLDDVAATIGCPRTCLHVVAADKGLVVGRISFREDGDLIDCTRMGARAWRWKRAPRERACRERVYAPRCYGQSDPLAH